MALSSPGIGSNIDVNGIVTQLMAVERKPLAALDKREAGFQAKLTAYGTLRGALSALKSAADVLDDPSRFLSASLTSSDNAVVTGTASGAAARGSLNVQVEQLAQRQSLVAAGQVSVDGALGSGATTTLTIERGTISGGTLSNGLYSGATFTPDAVGTAGTVTITAANNTLAGIRDAINAANVGVKASIVRDGSAAPYRLVLQGADSGAANSVRVSVGGDSVLSDLLAYDPAGSQKLSQTTAAQDAKAQVNGVPLSSRSNVFSDVMDGVSLTLVKTGTATVTVGSSNTAVIQSVRDLVKSYNDFNKALGDLSRSDPARKITGVLSGDASTRTLLLQLRATLSGAVTGGGLADPATLSQVGLTFQRDGSLALDSARLSSALDASPEAVARLFASGARATDGQVRVAATGIGTQPGSYAVDVTTAPTQGSVNGSAAAALTITAGVNDALAVNVDGTAATITLAAGTYTAASLASLLQTSLNAAPALTAAKAAVTVSESAGVLTLRSLRVGAASSVTVSGLAAADLFGPAPGVMAGTDAAGSIGGIAAVGEGRRLRAAAGTNAEGMELELTGGTTGSRGTVEFARGLAWRLNSQLDGVLGSEGLFAQRADGLNRSIDDIGRQRADVSRRLESVEQRFRAQFTALDGVVSRLLSTSSFLSQQLASLNNQSR
jgi:flagellar hook-associated protein 2